DNLARITVYVERVPSTEKTGFILGIMNFEFLNYRLVPAQSRGLYHSLYLALNLTSTNSSVSTLMSIQVEGRLDASPNTLYVIYLTIFVLLPLAVAVLLYDHFLKKGPKKSFQPNSSVDVSRG